MQQALIRTALLKIAAQLEVTILLVIWFHLPGYAIVAEEPRERALLISRRAARVAGLAAPVIPVPVVTLRATASPAGVTHHHHHHVVVLQGGGAGSAPPSRATMAALLQLPRQIVNQNLQSTTKPLRSMYQSVSTIGAGVTHQYHFHNAQDVVPNLVQQHPVVHAVQSAAPLLDPDAEWYAKQQSARVLALIGKLRDLGVHVDEVHADAHPPTDKGEPGEPHSSADSPKQPIKQSNKDEEVSSNVESIGGGKPSLLASLLNDEDIGGGDENSSSTDNDAGLSEEQVRKEMLKFIAKIQKKQKELHVDHSGGGWHSRKDVEGDFLAGGDLDVNVDSPRTVYEELAQLGADLHVGLPT